MNHECKVVYNGSNSFTTVSQYNFGKTIEFYNERPEFVKENEQVSFMNSLVARFHLRNIKPWHTWRGFAVSLSLLVCFASCKKSIGVEFTTFNGVPAGVYTVTVEAQQTNASSIWSPVSSITIAK